MVVTPQPQPQAMLGHLQHHGGRSKTCRASVEDTGARRSDPPHPSQAPGRYTMTLSGSATCRSVKPASPGCLPGKRSDRSRRDRGGGLPGPSADGGFDDVRESLRSKASNSATRVVNIPIRASRSPPQLPTVSAAPAAPQSTVNRTSEHDPPNHRQDQANTNHLNSHISSPDHSKSVPVGVDRCGFSACSPACPGPGRGRSR
jgi:hypothetical protein